MLKSYEWFRLEHRTGVDLNIKQRDSILVSGLTPLHLAVTYGNLDAVKLLLDKGADVNAAEGDEQTALMMACQGDNLEIVKLLVTARADVNVRDCRQQSPLQVSILRSPTEITLLLIEYGANIKVVEDGQSSLHYSSEWGNYELVQTLLEKEADVNLQDLDGNVPLHLTNDEKVLTLLLKYGADTSVRNKKAKPPLKVK